MPLLSRTSRSRASVPANNSIVLCDFSDYDHGMVVGFFTHSNLSVFTQNNVKKKKKKASNEQMFCRQITQVPVRGVVISSLITATCFSQYC